MNETGGKPALKAIAPVELPARASGKEVADFVRGLAILDDVVLRARRLAVETGVAEEER